MADFTVTVNNSNIVVTSVAEHPLSGSVVFGTTSAPSTTGLADGTVYFQYEV